MCTAALAVRGSLDPGAGTGAAHQGRQGTEEAPGTRGQRRGSQAAPEAGTAERGSNRRAEGTAGRRRPAGTGRGTGAG